MIPADVTAPPLIKEVRWVVSDWLKSTTKPNHINRKAAIHPPPLRGVAVSMVYRTHN